MQYYTIKIAQKLQRVEAQRIEVPKTARIETPKWSRRRGYGRVTFPSRLGVWGSAPVLSVGSGAEPGQLNHFSCENASDGSNFHHFNVGRKR